MTNIQHSRTDPFTVKLTFNANQINVFYDDLVNPKISSTDTNTSWFTNGSIVLDMWTGNSGPDYTMSVQQVVVTP